MYDSSFDDMLSHVNAEPEWQRILQSLAPGLHMMDSEILLRGLATLILGDEYTPSMVRFLNRFSRRCEHDAERNTYLQAIFVSFLEACKRLLEDAFFNKSTRRSDTVLSKTPVTAVSRMAFAGRRLSLVR